jgi:hypothetical protein
VAGCEERKTVAFHKLLQRPGKYRQQPIAQHAVAAQLAACGAEKTTGNDEESGGREAMSDTDS